MKALVGAVVSVLAAVPMLCLPQERATNSAQADFPQLSRYGDADKQLLDSRSGVKVVFLGDSLTEYWGSRSGKWFSYSGWINRGIGGQTTAQLLLRESSDALDLRPAAIVLEGGSNDMRLGFSPEAIRDRFVTMGELAQFHHVAVFVATMTPTCDCFRPLSGLRTVDRIRQLNELLASMCAKRNWTLIDINSPLADASGHMQQQFTVDGVHPNDAGYSAVSPAIERALKAYR
jgi:lysophospholipase L1-like esterase